MDSSQFYIDRIKADSYIQHYLSAECGFDLEDKEELDDDLEFLLEGGKCGFKLLPFGCDGSGGVYVLADDGRVGYIDSEGGAGFTACSIGDFFSILVSCGYISDWAKASRHGCFDSLQSFMEQLEDSVSPSEEYKKRIADFCCGCGLETAPEKIYEMFKKGVISQPPLEIKADDDDYEDYEPLFDTEG